MDRPRSHQSVTVCAVCHSLSCTKAASDRAERRQSMARASSPGMRRAVLPEVRARPRPPPPVLAQRHRRGEVRRLGEQRGQGARERLGPGAKGGRAARMTAAAPRRGPGSRGGLDPRASGR